MEKKQMSTLSEVMNGLREKGQDGEFKLADSGLGFIHTKSSKLYSTDDLRILKTYRFEGESDPSDSSILYLIESKDGQIGYIIDAYGVYSSYDDDAFNKLIHEMIIIEK